MTKDKDLASDTFQVVLIDLRMAAQGEIHCVEKPLTDDLKYVAISYRWGELEETIIDTCVGYVASITSFYILNFYKLCGDIIKEPMMASIPYVWVDAICINQTNHDQRKETIYHMSEIYEHATWILAVPDMHSAHLKAMHESVMVLIQQHRPYLYHLLHGNTDQLHKMDQDFLDDIGVPQELRQELIAYTDSFAESFMTRAKLNRCYDHVLAIEHLYDLTSHREAQPNINPHQCDEAHCPLDYFHDLSKLPFQPPSKHWGRRIIERRSAIHQTMQFLTNLVVDWSSRVWVISEFHISKKKNNLKFWFNQFRAGQDVRFFTVDTNDTRFGKMQTLQGVFSKTTIPVYIRFYQQLLQRLNRQTFFQMMLKSKASRNEDRFHAIFPFFPQYRHLLQNKALVTNINSIHAVKLKLYEVMTAEDKRLLFYFSAKGTPTYVLPTFATTAIYWLDQQFYATVAAKANATMVDISLQGSYLCVKPTTYQISRAAPNEAAAKTLHRLLHPKTLKVDDEVDVVLLFDTMLTPITIIGSLEDNIWILESNFFNDDFEVVDNLADDFLGFHVY